MSISGAFFAATVTVTGCNLERINLFFVSVTVTAVNSQEFEMYFSWPPWYQEIRLVGHWRKFANTSCEIFAHLHAK